jgi:hypothetical protein
MLAGCLTLWTYRRTADTQAVGTAIDRIQAHLLEFWLYADAPALVWKSWKGLLVANTRLYRLLAKPLLILFVPSMLLYLLFDAEYGTAPLAVGKPAVVTMTLSAPIAAPPRLQAPDGIAAESPPVRVFSRNEVSWRIRPLRPISTELAWTAGGQKLTKSVAAGPGFRLHSSRSLPRLISGPVTWIEIEYPPALISFAGLEAHWLVWFALFSAFGAAVTAVTPL